MHFLDLATDRYSCRSMTNQSVEPEKIEKILEACTQAPTALNSQPFKVWVFQSAEALAKVRAITDSHFDAPVIMVIGSAKNASGYIRDFDGRNFNDVDTTIAATHLMLEVHDLGLGTTWVGHFDVNKMNDSFPEMKDYDLLAMFPIGYPAGDAKPSGSKKRKAIVEFSEMI